MKKQTNTVFFLKRCSFSFLYCTFALWFWKESPVKVHLAVLNWELGCESPTVPQQWTPLWLLSLNAIKPRLIAFTLDKVRKHSALFLQNYAIGYLPEKALGSGGKSEDQPFSVTCQTTLDVRAWSETIIFVGLWNMNQSSSCTTVVRQIENSQSLVLAVEFQDGGNLPPHWQYSSQMLRRAISIARPPVALIR